MLYNIVAGCLSVFAAYLYGQGWQSTPEPRLELVNYISTQMIVYDYDPSFVYEDIIIDDMQRHTGTTCLTITGYDLAKKNVFKNLNTTLPSQIAQDVTDMAIMERTSTSNTYSNTITSSKESQLTTYFVFYHTNFHPPETYDTCIIVGVIQMNMADYIIGYEETISTRIVGYEKVNCFLLFCSERAITERVTHKKPILKKHAFTTSQHKYLQHSLLSDVATLLGIKYNSTLERIAPVSQDWNISKILSFNP